MLAGPVTLWQSWDEGVGLGRVGVVAALLGAAATGTALLAGAGLRGRGEDLGF